MNMVVSAVKVGQDGNCEDTKAQIGWWKWRRASLVKPNEGYGIQERN
jgi:hypothetical protein